MGSEITDNLAKQVAPTDNKGFDAYQLLTEGRSLKSQTGSTNLHAVEINRDSAAAATGKAAGESAASSVSKSSEGEPTSGARPKSSESKAVSSGKESLNHRYGGSDSANDEGEKGRTSETACAGGKKGADGAATQSQSEAAQGSSGRAIPGEQQQDNRAHQIPGGSVEKDQPLPLGKNPGNYEKDQPMPLEKNPRNYEKGSADPSGSGNAVSGITEKGHSIAVPDGQTNKPYSEGQMPGPSGGLKSHEPAQLPHDGTSFNKPYTGQPVR